MKKAKKLQNVRLNLSLDIEFYKILQNNAKLNYMKTATWVKQLLKRSLLGKNNSIINSNSDDPSTM